MFKVFRIILVSFFVFFFLSANLVKAQEEILVPIKVEKGVNLIKLAQKFCFQPQDWVEIAYANNLKPPYEIEENTHLFIPLRILVKEIIGLKVEKLSGKAYQILEHHQKIALNENDMVFPGAIIVTEKDSQVELIMYKNRRIIVKPEAVLQIVYLIRLVDGSLKASFMLEKGRILNIIEEKLAPGDIFEIKTPVALTGVRGTHFRVKMPEQDTNIIESLQGVVTVQASGKKVDLPEGKGSVVKKNEPLLRPEPLPKPPSLPNLQPLYKTLPIIIKTPIGPYKKLHVTIVRDEHFVTEKFVSPGDDIYFAKLDDGYYSLFVTGIDEKGLESPSKGPLFFRVRTKPSAPIINHPKQGLKTWKRSLRAKWLEVEGASVYKVVLATDPGFNKILITEYTEKPSYQFKNLKPGNYFLKVASVAADGFESDFSEVISWQILLSPSKTSVKEDENILYLQWQSSGKNFHYELQMARDKEFKKIIFNKKDLQEPKYALQKPKKGGRYYIRVRSIKGDGEASGFSTPQSFEVEQGPCGLCGVVTGTTLAILVGIILL